MVNNSAVSTIKNSEQYLPTVAFTRSGVEFNPESDVWKYRENTKIVTLRFDELGIPDQLLVSVKKVLQWYAENKSPDHLQNMFGRFKHLVTSDFVNRSSLVEITSNDLINYKSSLSKRNSWYLTNLSGFLKKWHALQIPGVSNEAYQLLNNLRLRGNQKGEAVLTMDLRKGAFSDIEVQAIHSALESAVKVDLLNLGDYLLIWLFLALGQRPVQYASLKICDFSVTQANDGSTLYELKVPRAKQKDELTRASFKRRLLIPLVGEKLVSHVNMIKQKFSKMIDDPDLLPLFPAIKLASSYPLGFEYHQTSSSVSAHVQYVAKKLNIVSERTGELLHMIPIRFRRTVGTRAAQEGLGELIIAELLDHTDTQNVGPYVEATSDIIERIDLKIAFAMAPLAQAFSGKIIRSESDATRKGDPSSRISSPKFDPNFKPLGNCGDYSFCGKFAPISCYTCHSFEPWLDGPHKKVLVHLISERERLISQSDMRISTINDRTIFAVASVVLRCDEMNKESGGQNG